MFSLRIKSILFILLTGFIYTSVYISSFSTVIKKYKGCVMSSITGFYIVKDMLKLPSWIVKNTNLIELLVESNIPEEQINKILQIFDRRGMQPETNEFEFYERIVRKIIQIIASNTRILNVSHSAGGIYLRLASSHNYPEQETRIRTTNNIIITTEEGTRALEINYPLHSFSVLRPAPISLNPGIVFPNTLFNRQQNTEEQHEETNMFYYTANDRDSIFDALLITGNLKVISDYLGGIGLPIREKKFLLEDINIINIINHAEISLLYAAIISARLGAKYFDIIKAILKRGAGNDCVRFMIRTLDPCIKDNFLKQMSFIEDYIETFNNFSAFSGKAAPEECLDFVKKLLLIELKIEWIKEFILKKDFKRAKILLCDVKVSIEILDIKTKMEKYFSTSSQTINYDNHLDMYNYFNYFVNFYTSRLRNESTSHKAFEEQLGKVFQNFNKLEKIVSKLNLSSLILNIFNGKDSEIPPTKAFILICSAL